MKRLDARMARGVRCCALVAGVAALAYVGTMAGGFVWDDHDLIEADPRTHSLLRAPAFLLTPFGGPGQYQRNLAYYRPLVSLTLAVDYALYGKHAWGYHLANVLFHAAASVGVAACLAAATGRAGPAALAGLAFAVHPSHAESVCWIAGRTDLLACAFMLWGTWFILRAWRSGRAGSYWTAALFGLALLSKEVALALPVFLLVADRVYARKAGRAKRMVGFHLLLFVLTGFFLLLRAMALHGSVPPPIDAGAGVVGRGLTACKLVGRYAWLLVWPVGLRTEHVVAPGRWLNAGTVAGMLIALALAWAILKAVWRGRDGGRAGVGAAWLLLALAPVLNLVPIYERFAERFAYVPSAAASAVAAVVGLALAKGRGRWLVAGCLVAWAALTLDRSLDWRSDGTLFRHAVQRAPAASRPRLSLALAYREAGRRALAGRECARSGALETRASAPHNALGNLHMEAGRLGEAIAAFERALKLQPHSPVFRVNLGRAWRQKGDLAKAAELFRSAIQLTPAYADAHLEMGNVYQLRGDMDHAADAYRMALACDPILAEANNNLGLCLLQREKVRDAATQFEAAIGTKPDYADAHRNLGYARFKLGQFSDAIAAYSRAADLEPYDIYTLLDLALLERKHGDPTEALALYERALRIDPKNDNALRGRAAARGKVRSRRDGER